MIGFGFWAKVGYIFCCKQNWERHQLTNVVLVYIIFLTPLLTTIPYVVP